MCDTYSTTVVMLCSGNSHSALGSLKAEGNARARHAGATFIGGQALGLHGYFFSDLGEYQFIEYVLMYRSESAARDGRSGGGGVAFEITTQGVLFPR